MEQLERQFDAPRQKHNKPPTRTQTMKQEPTHPYNGRSTAECNQNKAQLEQKLLGNIHDLMANWTEAEDQGKGNGNEEGSFILQRPI